MGGWKDSSRTFLFKNRLGFQNDVRCRFRTEQNGTRFCPERTCLENFSPAHHNSCQEIRFMEPLLFVYSINKPFTLYQTIGIRFNEVLRDAWLNSGLILKQEVVISEGIFCFGGGDKNSRLFLC